MSMTLEQQVARLKLVADGLRRIQEFESARYLDEYATHLTQAAQSVDIGAIREVIAELQCTSHASTQRATESCEAWANKLTAALHEKAG